MSAPDLISGNEIRPFGPVATDFVSPGPKSTEFLRSTAQVVFAMGPVGAAKSSTCFMKAFRNVQRQPVNLRTGEKKIKTTVIVDTYKNLHNKALVTFADIVPRESPVAKWRGGKGEDVEVKLKFQTQEGGPVHDMWWHFLAVGDRNIESITAGLLTTDVYLYEADKLPLDAINQFAKRLARYPEVSDFAEGQYIIPQLYGDFNAPSETHPLYRRLALENKPTDHFVVYPSGLSPDAENLAHLNRRRPNYYAEQMAAMNDPDMIRRMIENKPGYSRHGKPVYSQFSNELHTALGELKPEGHLPLILGVDGGGQAAAVLCEPFPSGKLHVLDEFITQEGDFTNAETFGEEIARYIGMKYPGRAVVGVGDPANTARSATRKDEMSWIRAFAKAAKMIVLPAPTNRIGPGSAGGAGLDTRVGAVNGLLGRLIDGRPALQINPSCLHLREGFTSGYCFKKIHGLGGIRYGDKPDKGTFSHVHDALQYASLMFVNAPNRLYEAASQTSRAYAPQAPHSKITVVA